MVAQGAKNVASSIRNRFTRNLMGFQERSIGRSTIALREDLDSLQLVNLRVPRRSAIIVSKPRYRLGRDCLSSFLSLFFNLCNFFNATHQSHHFSRFRLATRFFTLDAIDKARLHEVSMHVKLVHLV